MRSHTPQHAAGYASIISIIRAVVVAAGCDAVCIGETSGITTGRVLIGRNATLGDIMTNGAAAVYCTCRAMTAAPGGGVRTGIRVACDRRTSC